jgi:hypothetical protein
MICDRQHESVGSFNLVVNSAFANFAAIRSVLLLADNLWAMPTNRRLLPLGRSVTRPAEVTVRKSVGWRQSIRRKLSHAVSAIDIPQSAGGAASRKASMRVQYKPNSAVSPKLFLLDRHAPAISWRP